MPIRDLNLFLRQTSDGTLTSDHALTGALELEGTPIKGLAIKLTISSASGDSPHVTFTLHGTTTTTAPTSDSKVICQSNGALDVAAGGTTNPYVSYIIPFVDLQVRSIKAKLDTSGTCPVVATVEVAVVQNVGDGWTRGVNFH